MSRRIAGGRGGGGLRVAYVLGTRTGPRRCVRTVYLGSIVGNPLQYNGSGTPYDSTTGTIQQGAVVGAYFAHLNIASLDSWPEGRTSLRQWHLSRGAWTIFCCRTPSSWRRSCPAYSGLRVRR